MVPTRSHMANQPPDAPSSPRPPQRGRPPFGVRVIALLIVLRPLIELRRHGRLGLEGQPLAQLLGYVLPPDWVLVLLVGLMVGFVVLLALGLWRLSAWAWLLTILFTGYFLVRDLYDYFNAPGLPAAPDATPAALWLEALPLYLSMALNTVVVFYFNQREVRRAFGLDRPPGEGRPS